LHFIRAFFQVLLGLIFGMPLADPKAMQDFVHGSWTNIAVVAVWIPVQMLWMMLSVTMLSVAYREIVGLPPDAAAALANEAAPA